MKEELATFGFGNMLGSTLGKRRFVVEFFEPSNKEWFGNSQLVLRNDEVRFRCVRDRGADSFDFGPVFASEWFGLRTVIKLVSPHILCSDGFSFQLGVEEAIAHLIDSEWSHLSNLFSRQNLAATKLAAGVIAKEDLEIILKSIPKVK